MASAERDGASRRLRHIGASTERRHAALRAEALEQVDGGSPLPGRSAARARGVAARRPVPTSSCPPSQPAKQLDRRMYDTQPGGRRSPPRRARATTDSSRTSASSPASPSCSPAPCRWRWANGSSLQLAGAVALSDRVETQDAGARLRAKGGSASQATGARRAPHSDEDTALTRWRARARSPRESGRSPAVAAVASFVPARSRGVPVSPIRLLLGTRATVPIAASAAGLFLLGSTITLLTHRGGCARGCAAGRRARRRRPHVRDRAVSVGIV